LLGVTSSLADVAVTSSLGVEGVPLGVEGVPLGVEGVTTTGVVAVGMTDDDAVGVDVLDGEIAVVGAVDVWSVAAPLLPPLLQWTLVASTKTAKIDRLICRNGSLRNGSVLNACRPVARSRAARSNGSRSSVG
jgi:hypothetical protein